MKRWILVLVLLGLTAVMPAGTSALGATAPQFRALAAENADHYSLCQSRPYLCVDPYGNNSTNGEYTGHDEPSTLFYSDRQGSGNDMVYKLRLPTEPPTKPNQANTAGTWDFQLRVPFWFGLVMCDSQSAPEFTHTCVPDSDANNKASSNPKSPNYLGRHPGQAYMELQFYNPGYAEQFTGNGCTATQYCAAMTIDSLNLNQNTGVLNNTDCLNNHFLVGEEPINWAYITHSGKSQAPANPLALSNDPNLTGLTPNPAKDLMMNPGDRLRVWLHDTPAGFRVDITDLTTHQHGSMTASKRNGFGQILYQPKAAACHVRPYAFHPEYSTAVHRGTTWAAHSYNVAFSDEIGHFELCNAVDQEGGNCTSPGATEQDGLDNDDTYCLTGALSTLIPLTACLSTDNDFDGNSYLREWPGTFKNAKLDHRLHPTTVQFTSPRSDGAKYPHAAFETDLPRIEAADLGGAGVCDRTTGAGCVNPPPGAQFYPFFTTGHGFGGCVWQEGGRYIPGTTNTFGGTSKLAFGSLLKLVYPEAGFTTQALYNDYHRDLHGNPC
jgi:hypothetical protein